MVLAVRHTDFNLIDGWQLAAPRLGCLGARVPFCHFVLG